MKGRPGAVERHGEAVGRSAADRVAELMGERLDALQARVGGVAGQLAVMLLAVVVLAGVVLVAVLNGHAS